LRFIYDYERITDKKKSKACALIFALFPATLLRCYAYKGREDEYKSTLFAFSITTITTTTIPAAYFPNLIDLYPYYQRKSKKR
jgi:hypothetical protein